MESRQEEQNSKFKADLAQLIPVLREQVKVMTEDILQAKYLDEKSDEKVMIEELDAKLEIFYEYEKTSIKYNGWQEHLGTP